MVDVPLVFKIIMTILHERSWACWRATKRPDDVVGQLVRLHGAQGLCCPCVIVCVLKNQIKYEHSSDKIPFQRIRIEQQIKVKPGFFNNML